MVLTRREEEAPADGGAAPEPELPHQVEAGMLGLAVASAAITFAVSQPPPWLDRDDAYFAVALSGAFFIGVAQVAASVVRATTGARRRAPGSKLLYAPAVVLLGVAAGLGLASLLR